MDFPTLAKFAADVLEKYSILSETDLQLMKNLMSPADVEQYFSAWTSAMKERGFPYKFFSLVCEDAHVEDLDLPYIYPLEKQNYALHYADERVLSHYNQDDRVVPMVSISRRNGDGYQVHYYGGHKLKVSYSVDRISIAHRNSPFTGDYIPEAGLLVECEKLSVHVSPDGSVKVTPAK